MRRESTAECEDGRPNADCRKPFFLKISFFLFGPRPNTRAGPNRFSTETVKTRFDRPTVSVRSTKPRSVFALLYPHHSFISGTIRVLNGTQYLQYPIPISICRISVSGCRYWVPILISNTVRDPRTLDSSL